MMDCYSLKVVLTLLCLVACIEAARPKRSSTQSVLYKIEVTTSDEFGAGTDADVFINIFGSLGNTSSIQLTKSGNLFERDSHDEFQEVAKYVGNPITKVAVMRNNEGLFPNWKLDKILVKGTSPLTYKFAFNEWIPANEWVYSYGGRK